MKRAVYAIGLAATAAIVLGASFAAYTGRLSDARFAFFSEHDYIFHGLFIGPVAFFLDGVLGFRALTRRGWFPPLAAALVIAVAGAEELAQSLSPRRTTTLHDFVSDVVGVIVFVAIGRAIRARASNPSPSRAP